MSIKNLQSGFSLVETLVAISIVLIVIVGPMTIMSTAANSTNFTNEQVAAFFLAQEGVELAQKARDDLILQRFAGASPAPYASFWDEFSDNDTAGPTGPYENCFVNNTIGCGLEISENADGAIETPINCSTGDCSLYFDDTAGNIRSRYTHDVSAEPTPYSRVITFERISAYDVRVISRVEWFSGFNRNAQDVEVETVLFNVYAP